MMKQMIGKNIHKESKFQIRMEVMYSAEDGILEIEIDEVDEIKDDFFNNDKIGYDTYEAYYYAIGEREVSKNFFTKQEISISLVTQRMIIRGIMK